MVLNRYRKKADSVLLPLAKKMEIVDPDLLSWLAFLFAVLAGSAFYLSEPFFVLLAGIFVLMNSFLDAMDGRVAKLTGQDSIKGDFLDHSIDRFADIFILAGIAFSSLCRLPIGFLGVLGVIMASYMGTQAHAVGAGRNYGGVAGRADRLLLLIFVPLIYFILEYAYITEFPIFSFELTIFELLMGWFAIAGFSTALHRGISTWRDLED